MHSSIRLALLTAFLCIFSLTMPVLAQNTPVDEPVIVRRAAFDIGSAAIKCTIADVDTTTNTIVTVVQELSRKVDFAEDMARSYDGNLSQKIMDDGLSALQELKAIALEHHAREFSAIGGAVFRSARNGRAYFVTLKEKTGISCRVTSMQQSALLSFHAVRQRMSEAANLLVWDIGGSSMQMITRDREGGLIFYEDSIASVSFKNIVISVIQGKDAAFVSSPNPVTPQEVKRALDYVTSYAGINVPPDLTGRIHAGGMHIVGIGGVHNYAIPEMLNTDKEHYSREEIKVALEQWTGKPDEDFNSEYANTRLTNLILVLGYMNALHMDAIEHLKVNEADGLLAAPEFW